MREETVLIVVCLLLSIAIVIVSMCMFEWRPKLPKLFHKVPGDEVIPDGTFGIVIREADQPVRWRELLFIVPVPGRYMRLVDFDQAVVLNARINAWVGFHIPPGRWLPSMRRGLQMRGCGHLHEHHRLLRVYRAP